MEALRSQSLTEDAYLRLRADLLACRLAPGSKVKINEISALFAVSVGVVREALARLSAEGLVTAEAQRGFRVPPIAARDLADLSQARVEIECICLTRAIEDGDVDWEARILAAYHRMSRVPEREPTDPKRLGDAYASEHAAFHAALVGGCANSWLLRMRSMLFDQSERYRRLSVPLQNPRRDLDSEHRKIMEATLARDGARACRLLADHLARTAKILLDSGVCDAD
ncbi:MAG: FCD domain-containing protein [Proteobacteria bacterium]|nr:FCD domain-containing protein [Pseudomonadota bacterium]